MEDESGARILIRGKGSSKDPTGDPDEEEELHVLIVADTDESIAKAQSLVEEILFNPHQAMKLKQEQLRKYVGSLTTLGASAFGVVVVPISYSFSAIVMCLRPNRVAELNGTLVENYGRPQHGGNDGPAGHYGPGVEKEAKTCEMSVPRDLVGYIIGRGGETIRDLQAKSGAHIQIVREEDGAPQLPERFVSISGSDEALELAQKLIQNLIDERQQNSAPGGGGGGGFRERDDRDRMARYGGINPDGSETVELLVPNERVGLIIGRGGVTIKSIQARTGATITIPQTPDVNNPNMRLITIRGTVDSKEMAKQEIIAMVNEEPGHRSQGPGYGASTIYMQVPNDRVGVVIGKRGETIKGIQDRHLVRIQIPQVPDPGSNPPVRTISIQGPVNSLQGAKEEVDMIILQGAGSHSYGGQSQYGGSSSYGGSTQYGGSSYDQQQQYDPYGQQQQQQQQYGYGQGQYDSYYQQYYQQDGSAGTAATTAAASSASTSAVGSTTADATATTAASDPNDPNAYWNGYYEYAAYYGVDAANAAWGVTGEAAVAATEAYKQYQEQTAAAGGDANAAGATAEASSTSAPATEAASTSDASAQQVC